MQSTRKHIIWNLGQKVATSQQSCTSRKQRVSADVDVHVGEDVDVAADVEYVHMYMFL